jgi:hypothetical protein
VFFHGDSFVGAFYLSLSSIDFALTVGNFVKQKTKIVAMIEASETHGAIIWLADSFDFSSIETVPFQDLISSASNGARSAVSVSREECVHLVEKAMSRIALIYALPDYIRDLKVSATKNIDFIERWDEPYIETHTNGESDKVCRYHNQCALNVSGHTIIIYCCFAGISSWEAL